MEYFNMGGYAGYVWPAYAITAIVMIGILVSSIRSWRSTERELAQIQAMRGQRRRPAKAQAETITSEAEGQS